jgi:hypothetical protein
MMDDFRRATAGVLRALHAVAPEEFAAAIRRSVRLKN